MGLPARDRQSCDTLVVDLPTTHPSSFDFPGSFFKTLQPSVHPTLNSFFLPHHLSSNSRIVTILFKHRRHHMTSWFGFFKY